VETVEDEIRRFDVPIKVAVMGCVVNGPGEAREADVGIAGGNGFGILFRNGNVIKKVNEDELLSELIKEIEKIQLEHSKDDSKC
jgi:(E)-4-hydroxy-3-methylbut-2-enyl-diphosphate synthase